VAGEITRDARICVQISIMVADTYVLKAITSKAEKGRQQAPPKRLSMALSQTPLGKRGRLFWAIEGFAQISHQNG